MQDHYQSLCCIILFSLSTLIISVRPHSASPHRIVMTCMYSREELLNAGLWSNLFHIPDFQFHPSVIIINNHHVLLLHFSKTYKVLVLENIFDILGDHFASGRVFIYLQTSGPKLVGVARVFIEIIFSIFSIFSKFSYFRMLYRK